MGTWGHGPFDNDTAADWGNDLDDLPAAERPTAVRAALERALAEDGYLDGDYGTEAVAAAAVVASQCSGGPSLEPPYAPEEPVPPLPDDLPPLALRALNRVCAPDSELAELWSDGVEPNLWLAELERLRVALVATQPTAEYPRR